MKKLIANRYILAGATLLIGLWASLWLNSPDSEYAERSAHQHADQSGVWTCSMHPQIREKEPGQCPICGMDLVLIDMESPVNDGEADRFTIKLSDNAMKIAEISTTLIEKSIPKKEVYLPGKVMADERRIAELTARFPGRIEELKVNFTGQKVYKGQVLAKIYSPSLATAQKELLEAFKYKTGNPGFYQASRQKLKLWDLTEEQITGIENSGEVNFYFDVLSPISGTVTVRHVTLGDYVKEGSALFEVTNLRHLWVVFDAYESDLPWIRPGEKINFTIKSIPGKDFTATVTFIDPVINPLTRVAGVRAELGNPQGLLKPHMLASGVLQAQLPGSGGQLVVPKSAVLWTGKKAVVYVRTSGPDNLFRYREINLGAEAGGYYVVQEGLDPGEIVASNGVFKIDAASQLQGKQSMMNPTGGRTPAGHDHGGQTERKDTQDPGTSNHSEHPEIDEPKGNLKISQTFKNQLRQVYIEYLPVKDALVATDSESATANALKLMAALNKVDMSLVKDEAHITWMKHLKVLKATSESISSENNIEKMRQQLSPLSDQLYETLKKFGVETGGFRQYCPMAFNNKGAFWLSNSDEVLNPYFGDAMLTCGSVEEELN